jgi:hypothetical protein
VPAMVPVAPCAKAEAARERQISAKTTDRAHFHEPERLNMFTLRCKILPAFGLAPALKVRRLVQRSSLFRIFRNVRRSGGA